MWLSHIHGGGNYKSHEIIINGHSVMVTENVKSILSILRDKEAFQNGWKIWIDALCINQADIEERGRQIKRMKYIYSRSWTPLVWLGGERDESDKAMNLIRILSRDYTGHDDANKLTDSLHKNPTLFGEGYWRALHQIATRPYWRRAWVMQEAAMGRKSTPILCGHQSVPWVDITNSFRLLAKTSEVINTVMTKELKDVGLGLNIVIWVTFYTVSEVHILRSIQDGQLAADLNRLLCLGRNVLATDSRDQLYSLLGLMDPSIVANVRPDYTASIQSVYMSFAETMIRTTGGLEVLRHCDPLEKQELPSWVPDWRLEPTTESMILSTGIFHTSRSLPAVVSLSDSDNNLTCRGFKFDTFDGFGCRWTKGWKADSVVQPVNNANPYGDDDDVRAALWKTVTAGRKSEHPGCDFSCLLATPALKDAPLDGYETLSTISQSDICDWCVKSFSGNYDFKICGKPLRGFLPTSISPEDIDPVVLREALMQRDRVNVNRLMIMTTKGYLGMALDAVRAGDCIFVLLGCSMPMVLRPVDDGRYRVVGEIYVHGIMEGENEWPSMEELEHEYVTIC
jgi:hypothetical protein